MNCDINWIITSPINTNIVVIVSLTKLAECFLFYEFKKKKEVIATF